MNKEFNIIYRVLAILEAILLLVLSFAYGSKIDKQAEIINNQEERIKSYKQEIIQLKLVEQDYQADKEYIYECYKQIEQKAERSGR
jgi:hypothetical protein